MEENHDDFAGRYSRQTLFGPIGDEGQRCIGRSRVVVVGCGAVGGVAAGYLARGGVGELSVVDRDLVEPANLQRQVLFGERDASERLPKAVAAARRLRDLNSAIDVEPLTADVNACNVEQIVTGAQVVVDGTDNLDTRLLLNDACLKAAVPWLYGGAVGASGAVMPVLPGEGPCLRCLLRERPPPGALPTCDRAGVLGAAPGVVGSLQASLALRILVDDPPPVGLLVADVWNGVFRRLEVPRRSDCPACVGRNFEHLERDAGYSAATMCGRNAVQILPSEEGRISLQKLEEKLSGVAETMNNGYLLSFRTEGCSVHVFPNGRAIVQGTDDPARARGLYARYVGS